MAKSICLYLHIHQPYRLTKINYLDIGTNPDYFTGSKPHTNKFFLNKVADKSYLPTNKLLLKLLQKYPDFKLSISITGVVLEQMQKFRPEVLESFKHLINTGKVEILGETYYHSLASMNSIKEFKAQVEQHRELIKQIFGLVPRSFRNTELIYNDRIGKVVSELGFDVAITEGWEPILKDRSPNYVYTNGPLRLLLKNYKLSDDLAFRFSDKNWSEYPLSVNKFCRWISNSPGDSVNLFMDYETFGEHQWEDSGIFKLLSNLPKTAEKSGIVFRTVFETARDFRSKGKIGIKNYISWADSERDTSAWTGNKMQQSAIKTVYELEKLVLRPKLKKYLPDWRKLQISDHFYYMSTKYWSDGDVHKYFSPYESPYEAFINYMNILEDFRQRLDHELKTAHAQKIRLRTSNRVAS